MDLLQETAIACPYCGETITVLVDESLHEQQYIEDCQVCCRPIVLHVQVSGNGQCRVEARHEDEV